MDATDRQFAEMMIRLHTDNLDYLRAEGDQDYNDIVYCLNEIARWRGKLHDATFAQIGACSR